jgi:hypothetical protein
VSCALCKLLISPYARRINGLSGGGDGKTCTISTDEDDDDAALASAADAALIVSLCVQD